MLAYVIEAPPIHANAGNYFLAALGFYRLGYVVERFKLSTLKTLDVSADTPVFGGMESLEGVLPSYQGLSHYPAELKAFLHRKVEIRDIEAVQPGEFFKPLESQQKLFLPRVKDRSFQCELLLDKIPAGTRVWVSSAVSFLAEYRVYVRRGQVLNVCFYKGDPLIQPEVGAIAAMVSATKSCAVAYAIDVGVLESGETALVELSDFCCLGNYGLKAIDYAACIAERWAEVWQDT